MSIIVRNPSARVKDTELIEQLQAFMLARPEATQAELEAAMPLLGAMTQGELHQLALDAGFVVELDNRPGPPGGVHVE